MSNRDPVKDLHPLEEAQQRFHQIEANLRQHATRTLEFDFDPSGTSLFSIMELRQAYARRAIDIIDAVFELLSTDHILPAATLGRALIETIAMGTLFLDDIASCISDGRKDRLEVRLRRFYSGMAGREPKPIHVMDAMRHLEKVDAAYVAYLDSKFGVFSAFDTIIKAKKPDTLSHKQVLSMMKVYDDLSEIAHPNGIGTQYLYPDPTNETEHVRNLRALYRRQAVAAVWQCKHLNEALNNTIDLPSRYQAVFMSRSE